MKEKLKALLGLPKLIWNAPRERALIRSVIFFCVFLIAGWGYFSFQVYRTLHPVAHKNSGHGHEANLAHNEEAGGHDKSEADSHSGKADQNSQEFGASPIPNDILERQDGVEEPDLDLKEAHKEKRALASIDTGGLVVERGNYFYSLDSVTGGLRAEKNRQYSAFLDLRFEVDKRVVLEELKSKDVEIRALVTSLVSSYERDYMMSLKGKEQFKIDLMNELNYRINKGRVIDVLYSKVVVR